MKVANKSGSFDVTITKRPSKTTPSSTMKPVKPDTSSSIKQPLDKSSPSKSISNLTISDLPEEEKAKVTRLVEKLVSLGKEHEEAMAALSLERSRHASEMEDANQKLEAMRLHYESSCNSKDGDIIGIEKKYKHSLNLLGLYQQRLSFIVDLLNSKEKEIEQSKAKNNDMKQEVDRLDTLVQSQRFTIETMESTSRMRLSEMDAKLLDQERRMDQISEDCASSKVKCMQLEKLNESLRLSYEKLLEDSTLRLSQSFTFSSPAISSVPLHHQFNQSQVSEISSPPQNENVRQDISIGDEKTMTPLRTSSLDVPSNNSTISDSSRVPPTVTPSMSIVPEIMSNKLVKHRYVTIQDSLAGHHTDDEPMDHDSLPINELLETSSKSQSSNSITISNTNSNSNSNNNNTGSAVLGNGYLDIKEVNEPQVSDNMDRIANSDNHSFAVVTSPSMKRLLRMTVQQSRNSGSLSSKPSHTSVTDSSEHMEPLSARNGEMSFWNGNQTSSRENIGHVDYNSIHLMQRQVLHEPLHSHSEPRYQQGYHFDNTEEVDDFKKDKRISSSTKKTSKNKKLSVKQNPMISSLESDKFPTRSSKEHSSSDQSRKAGKKLNAVKNHRNESLHRGKLEMDYDVNMLNLLDDFS